MSRLLLIEDDPQISEILIQRLAELGHTVICHSAAASALTAALAESPDIVLLDLGLPDMDGSTLLMMLRSLSPVPVVVITARTDEREAVRLLDLGADDYVTKPFDVVHLEARIRAVLRRSGPPPDGVINIGALQVDPASGEVRLGEEPVSLRRRDFEVLLVLARNAGKLVPRADIARQVWGQHAEDSEGRLDVHLSHIRAALGESAKQPRYLHTLRGIGVRLAAPRV